MLHLFRRRCVLQGFIPSCSRVHVRSLQCEHSVHRRRTQQSPTFEPRLLLHRRQYHDRFHEVSVVPEHDSIYALSTAPGRAAIAVIRISGPACLQIYSKLCPATSPPRPRIATLRKIRSPDESRRILDTGALVLYFPAPKTVTGEDILELHVHGGPAIVRSVLEAISQVSKDGAHITRPAEAGEFTKRAFYNDRIDLTEVEALGEALVAETEQQRRLAVSGATSGLTQRYEEWRNMLLYARGELEALIDFSEDQYFDESPQDFISSVSSQIVDLKRKLDLHVLNSSRGELLRNGISVALLGAPNAGKSSLLNRIVGREAAIVSAEEGTTRDIVDVSIDIKGWLVRLGDMAGLRVGISPLQSSDISLRRDDIIGNSTVGEIEREGIRRARERALQSDLVVVLISLQPTASGSVTLCLNNELIDAVKQCRASEKDILFALNKVDLLHSQSRESRVSLSRLLSKLIETFPDVSPHDVFCLSCKEADYPNPEEPDSGGLQTFLDGLASKFSSMTSAAIGLAQEGSPGTLSAAEAQNYWTASLNVTHRQSQNLKECVKHLDNFLEISSPDVAGQPSINTLGSESATKVVTPNITSSHSGFFDTGEDNYSTLHSGHHNYHIDNHDDIVGESILEEVLRQPPRDHLIEKQYGHNEAPKLSSAANAEAEVDIVTAAEHLRNAADCLAKLTGRGDGVSSGADVEDVLGVVFEK